MKAQMKVEYLNHMGNDCTVVNAARVSFNNHQHYDDTLTDKDIRLIKYLAKHKHWSPFSHCFMQFKIKAPIFVARQLGKHQVGLAWNEISRRYVDYEPEFYQPQEWRGRPANTKQGSDGVVDVQLCEVNAAQQSAFDAYQALIEQGAAPEMARMVLPQSMMTEWFWSGSLYAFARVCQQRLDPHSQIETAEIAEQISDFCSNLFPHSWQSLLALPEGDAEDGKH